jgi:hypothetical protein
MSVGSEAAKQWRKRTKERLVKAMGGKCASCDYNKSTSALEFHHLDPNKKDFSLSEIRANPKSWTKIIEEIRKCILLCCRCHREVHDGILDIPASFPVFDEQFVTYASFNTKENQNECPVCGKLKSSHNITCSLSCAAKNRYKIEWHKYNIEEMLKTMSYLKIASLLGCSDMAVRKQHKKQRCS